MADKDRMQYMVGGLLYMPALQDNIVPKILGNEIAGLTSIAFCLEDAIRDSALGEAERQFRSTLARLRPLCGDRNGRAPLLFLRVRTPEHMRHMSGFLGEDESLLAGYILPKFDLGNGEAYAEAIREINRGRSAPLYVMPVLESGMIADAGTRAPVLCEIKKLLDGIAELVLNVRVGANDFGNLYGLRRPVSATIYSVGIVRDILMDILNVFARDYVVSGPVWNYFGTADEPEWQEGLRRELALDRLNGFIGKTAIHPAQLPLICQSLAVTREDYEDACALLDWKPEKAGVSKSARGNRMNEVKCHQKWARRIKALKEIYGIREDAPCREQGFQ